MRTLSCILLVLFFTGCASNKANRKLKRANRLIAEAVALGAEVKADTIYKRIPIYIDSVVVDSIFVTTEGDTVYLEKERIKIKFVDLPGDSVYIEGKCDSLTKIVEVPITVTKEIKTGKSVLEVVQVAVLVGLICLIVGAILCRIFWI